MSDSKEVKPIQQQALPDFMKPVTGATGLEHMGEDTSTPRIQLAQAMSPQVKKKDPDYIDGLEEGQFFHSMTGDIIGEVFFGYILKVSSSRALFTEDNEVDCYSADNIHGSKHSPLCEDCAFSTWDNDTKTPPACRTFENIIVLPEGAETPALLSLKQSNKFATAESRNLHTCLRLHGAAGAYAAKYQFASKMVTNARKQSFYVTSAKPVGYVTDEELYRRLQSMAEQFVSRKGGAHE